MALLAFVVRPDSWFVRDWPEPQITAVRGATRDPGVRVWATDGTADWLLWRVPDLRGRMAYDVRFELYDKQTLDRIARYNSRPADWRTAPRDYGLVVVAVHGRGPVAGDDELVFQDGELAVIRRP